MFHKQLFFLILHLATRKITSNTNHINLLDIIDSQVGNEVDVTVDRLPKICNEGYFCEDGKIYPCGRVGYFCKKGSEKPSNARIGYYTVGGTITTRSDEKICEPGAYCIGGERFLCPKGRFGSEKGLFSETCTGVCQEGYYCEEGSVAANLKECGNSSVFCPEGSYQPTKVKVGYYTVGGHNTTRVSQIISPIGHYALNGVLYQCPAGTYGDTTGLSTKSCSGKCKTGFYCPAGSISSKQYACGSENVYCPKGVGKPIQAQEGYYTSKVEDECAPGKFRNSTDFKCQLCDEGTYKVKKGNNKELCLPCGFQAISMDNRISCICRIPESYNSRKELVFNSSSGKCDEEIETDQKIRDSLFMEDTQFTRSTEKECEIGYYCTDGIRYPCKPGKYGSKKRETNSECSGNCDAGYWCGYASKNATDRICGASNVFCPVGSPIPTYAQRGYFTNEDTPKENRHSQSICPKGHWCHNGIRYKCSAGRWGGTEGLYTPECDGLCKEGYFCPEGSINMTQTACGNESFYCPKGTKEPLSVDQGYHSLPSTLGHFTNDEDTTQEEKQLNQHSQSICPKGHWCDNGIRYKCGSGRWGNTEGLYTPECDGPCKAGYFCPEGSTNMTHLACGTYRYCPEGSKDRFFVMPGYYGKGDIDDNHYSEQVICEPGHYCDLAKRYICPEGTYGSTTGLLTRHCSGFCPPGFFCPEGTFQPHPCPLNSFSTSGAATCIDCGPRSLEEGEDGSHKCQNARICCSQ